MIGDNAGYRMKHIPALDEARGIAVILVLFFISILLAYHWNGRAFPYSL
jgi:hypothetical protein